MATIKSYTDVAQSKTLSNILPSESADGTWVERTHVEVKYVHSEIPFWLYGGLGIPSWSLAALLSVLPKGESINCSISFGYYNGKGEYVEKWLCIFEKEGETIDDDFIIETIDGSNLVDACYEMILKLHELKML